jgi:hypothetical protein
MLGILLSTTLNTGLSHPLRRILAKFVCCKDIRGVYKFSADQKSFESAECVTDVDLVQPEGLLGVHLLGSRREPERERS